MFDMAASPCIQCRIDPELKLRLQAIAAERGLTESAVLKRLVIGVVGMAPPWTPWPSKR
jgi:antitoxin component of RelBE/YafQ-DinJ toxin-antitoxin module